MCSCENDGVIPVIFSQVVSKNFGVDSHYSSKNSNIIPVKCHVDTLIIQMPFFPCIKLNSFDQFL